MTFQTGDRIRYAGGEYELSTLPLDSLPEEVGRIPGNLIVPSTACWRGYIAHWEIAGSKLWFVGIDAAQYVKGPELNRKVELSDIIPGASGGLLASWFTGALSIPQGSEIPDDENWDWMLPRRYVRTHELVIERGVVARVNERTAGDAAASGAELPRAG